ncbi:cryptococcal mannosyltransferase 1-domain-containing protein [Lipomyces oligophaga]|uniref:cryptococcal mannosyltransferase 1-domain-containing protein n=1 Tax=Lipomyces oligophaga TaxID=45792 RepID=UPI0034CDA0CD
MKFFRSSSLRWLRSAQPSPFVAGFLLAPAVVFRLKYLIITHNSLTLALFVAAIFVFLPFLLFRAFVRSLKVVSSSPRLQLSYNSLVLLIIASSYCFFVFSLGLSSPFPSTALYVPQSSSDSPEEAYFIAANFFNNEQILPNWIREIIKLIDVLGENNVFVSISENDSVDATASHIYQLTRYLSHHKIPYAFNVTTATRPFPNHNPWLDTTHRIDYMTAVRNTVFDPLAELSTTPLGERISRVIFLNDVLYHHTDVLRLLHDVRSNPETSLTPTVMACGLDMETATLYDQWALRDKCGRSVNGMYPYFKSPLDRQAVARGDIVEVGTCWNGVVVMHADVFMSPPRPYALFPDLPTEFSVPQSSSLFSDPDPLSTLQSPKSPSTPSTSTTSSKINPLRFPEPPGSCIISECTLLPLSLLNSYLMSWGGAVTPRIVVDTSVIVAYRHKWYWYYSYFLRTPIISTWISLVEHPILSLWSQFNFDSFYEWKELKDGCYPDRWIRCPHADPMPPNIPMIRDPPTSISAADQDDDARIKLMIPKPRKSKSKLLKQKDNRAKDLLKKTQKDLLLEKERLLLED